MDRALGIHEGDEDRSTRLRRPRYRWEVLRDMVLMWWYRLD
jgi:hypothetical protein